MHSLNITYILLIITILISLFCRDKRPVYLGIGITILAALYQGIINIIGFSTLIVFAGITYAYFNLQLNKIIKTLLFTSISVFFVGFAFHKVPGFFNILAIDKVQLSELSVPFTMYLNFDKVIPALIIFSLSDLYILEKQESSGTVKYTLLSLLLCIMIIMALSLISGYVLFEPKIPSILPIWAINNFFLVCMAEEVFFRGFLQRTLQNLLPKQQILAVIMGSIIHGLAHFRGGLIYIALTTICSFFPGYTYYKTNKILCSMIVHFGLNLFHILLFTYPALKIL
ncbi:MAG TPA: CPBP family intramembrane metalloprotease [Rickettsia endosymbiont of Omalisus fontisbellaquei]|nr:CPBP family intramembrane metalloprotease [Rickettsia endosymbiont of Omalisus fontisbellaquei]